MELDRILRTIDEGRKGHIYCLLHNTVGIWSGLRLKDRWLVRAFTLGREPQRVQIATGSGGRVVVDAPPAGATYLIHADDRTVRVIRQKGAPRRPTTENRFESLRSLRLHFPSQRPSNCCAVSCSYGYFALLR